MSAKKPLALVILDG
ncbi:2,3-bisphosphoglycerate-independent phosphoglycerate mutase, partial [Vibrio parahaemolyticus AQ3810]